MPTALRDVRSQGQSGKHLLALSFSAFDPNADIWPKPPMSVNGLTVIAAFGIRPRDDAYTPAPGLGSLSWGRQKWQRADGKH
jgi:hypothetical protein